MSDATLAGRDPGPATPPPTATPKGADALSKPNAQKGETGPAKAERDPVLDLVQRLQNAAKVLGDRDAGLVRGINLLAQQGTEPGRAEQPLFRTHVAYALQDMERIAGAGSTAMPVELRAEMTRLAATSPGLENRQMEALVRATPEIGDRGLVRDVRRAAALVAGFGGNQNAPVVGEQIEVLENRVRLAVRPASPAEATPGSEPQVAPERVVSQQPAAQSGNPGPRNTTAASSGMNNAPVTAPAPPSVGGTASEDKVRAVASPGGGEQRPGWPADLGKGQPIAVPGTPVGRQGPQGALASVLDKMRAPGPDAPPPWEPPAFNMAGRISRFEKIMSDGKTDQLIRASEKSGEALMRAVETFAAGPGAGVLAKIEAAASTESGGMRAVTAGMQPGGKYAALRSEFDNALQQDRVFAAAYNQVEKTGAQYGRDRLALGADFAARKLDANQLDSRFGQADALLGETTAKIPGRTPGKSLMDEMGEKLAEVLGKAAERVKQMFGREVEAGPRASPSPAMRPS